MFLLNLSLTSVLTVFNKQHVVIYISAGISFVIFIGIILYHAQQQILLIRVGAKVKKHVFSYFSGQKDEDDSDIQLQAGVHNINKPPKEVTRIIVELNQPLLENEIN